jgi:hypothetical protein
MKALLPIYFLLKNLFAGCHAEIKHTGFERDRIHHIERVPRIDTLVKEGSGLAFYKGLFWTIGDSGTPPELYAIHNEGHHVATLKNDHLKNIDWEELCVDQERGCFFIGDIGNNGNRRKDLKVYALDSSQQVSEIPISYALQKDFPAWPPDNNYDAEAMVYHRDSLFLMSKNRGTPMVKWYGFPVHEQAQVLTPAREVYLKGMITAAAYHESSQQLVLLSYGKMYWFKVVQGDILHAKPWLIKKIPFCGQTEAICFDDKGTVFFTNEKGRRWRVVSY